MIGCPHYELNDHLNSPQPTHQFRELPVSCRFTHMRGGKPHKQVPPCQSKLYALNALPGKSRNTSSADVCSAIQIEGKAHSQTIVEEISPRWMLVWGNLLGRGRFLGTLDLPKWGAPF